MKTGKVLDQGGINKQGCFDKLSMELSMVFVYVNLISDSELWPELETPNGSLETFKTLLGWILAELVSRSQSQKACFVLVDVLLVFHCLVLLKSNETVCLLAFSKPILRQGF